MELMAYGSIWKLRLYSKPISPATENYLTSSTMTASMTASTSVCASYIHRSLQVIIRLDTDLMNWRAPNKVRKTIQRFRDSVAESRPSPQGPGESQVGTKAMASVARGNG